MSRLMTARRFRPSRRRPRLELLEDRIAPAMIVWGNSSGGDWDTAANWQGGVKPGSADDAVINIAVTNPITHSQNTADVINSLSVTANAPVNLGNGTLQITGTLASNGSFTIAGGTLRNATVSAGTTITAASNSSNTLSGVTLDGTLDVGRFRAEDERDERPDLERHDPAGRRRRQRRRRADGAGHAGVVGHRQYPLRRLGHHVPGHFQRRDADPRRRPDPARRDGEIIGTFINQGTINADLAGRTDGSTRTTTGPSSARIRSIRGRCKSIAEPRSWPPVPGPTPAR